jgi:hypothetical protein
MRSKLAFCLFAGFRGDASTNLWIVTGQRALFHPSATALTVFVARTLRRSNRSSSRTAVTFG